MMERVVRLFRLLFLTWVCLVCLLKTTSAKHGKNSLPSAMVVGTVFCDTCFQQQDFSRSSHTISGASVAVECGDTGTGPGFRKEVRTDEHGEFMVELPFRVGKHIRSIKKCTVKLVNSSEPYCSVASSATSTSLHLKSRKQGIHIFSAGFFTFKPLKEPELCYQKPSPQTHSKFTSDQKTFLSSPQQPRLPPLLSIPWFPPLTSLRPPLNPPSDQTNPSAVSMSAINEKEGESRPDTFFFPSPPFGLPPNPFFPPPSILPPNPLLPSPPPFINFPPIPFFTPPPPPPIIPFFPFPPFPFPPSRPVFPGIPPADTTNEKSP